MTVACTKRRFVSAAVLLVRLGRANAICRKEGSGRPLKVTGRVLEVVAGQMRKDDETTAVEAARYFY